MKIYSWIGKCIKELIDWLIKIENQETIIPDENGKIIGHEVFSNTLMTSIFIPEEENIINGSQKNKISDTDID